MRETRAGCGGPELEPPCSGPLNCMQVEKAALETKYNKLCKGIRAGGTLPDPADCRRYIICCNGKANVQICRNCVGRSICEYVSDILGA